MKLTLPQQDIYFEQLLFPDEPIYNIGAKVLIDGPVDYQSFTDAYIALIQQHDAYQKHLKGDIDNVEMVHSGEIRPLAYMDFSGENGEERALAFMQAEFKKPFDIEKDIFLYRFILIKAKENLHYLFSVYHHIITDGWGTSLMFTRLVNNYNEILEHGAIQSEYPYSYELFVTENEKYLTSTDIQDDKKYWKEKFKSLPEAMFSKIDVHCKSNKSSRKELIIHRSVYNKVAELASQHNSTTFHVILAILYSYFGKKYQNSSISIGLPVLNRSGVKMKRTVGLFMGVTPLLISIDDEETFPGIVEKIKNQLRKDYRHQRFPLGHLVKELHLFHQKERLFNVTLSYEKQDYSDNFSGTVTRVIPLSHEAERVALAIYIREFDESEDVKIDFDYNLNYFTAESISLVAQHFEILLTEILRQPQTNLKDLNFLTTVERQQLLYGFNNTKSVYPDNKTIVHLFEEQVQTSPANIAVKDKHVSLTYRELKGKSDHIAAYLISRNGEKNEPVAVLVERSADLLVILLGILKAGKCYIPIDPTLPKDRISYIINHSQAPLAITENDLLQQLNPDNSISYISKDQLLLYQSSGAFDGSNYPDTSNTAYIIYTSGSTGNPKGVEIGHQALTNFITSIQHQPGITEKDVLYAVTTYSFDISILEFFTPLIAGATVFVASKETLNTVDLLKTELAQVSPSIIQATPSFYQLLFNAGWQGAKGLKVLVGGDSLNELLAEKLIIHSKEVWNMYGPTETTIWSSLKRIIQPSDASTIGKPINNTQVYVTDKHLNILPVNSAGRIFIAGDGLAKGYYKNIELTKEKFIHNPYADQAKMYDTGDLGKWNTNGELEFLGRSDFQVKIRGFRIELGEIETQLVTHSPHIKQAVVVAQEVNGDKVLIAYYTVEVNEADDNRVNKKDLRAYLLSKLPEYMVPGLLVEIESIPLTPNGKVDRKALPAVIGNDMLRDVYEAPGNATEEQLADIWQEVLELDKIGVNDNFFELGGHSLAAGKIVNSISQKLNRETSLRQIFQHDTIRKLAAVLGEKTHMQFVIPKAVSKTYYRITTDQRNIWLASQKEEYATSYNMYAVFEITGALDKTLLQSSLLKLVQQHEILRTNFIEKDGEICQFIREQHTFLVDKFKESAHQDINKLITKYISHRFNLENDLLIKIGIFQTQEQQNYLVFLTHHIIVDGMSLELLLTALIDIYQHYKVRDVAKTTFKDYVEWIQDSTHESKSAHWESYLMNICNTNLITDSSHFEDHGLIKSQTYHLPPEHYSRLQVFSQINKTTSYITIQTLLSVVLGKVYKQNNVCIGTVLNGRNYPAIADVIGMFIKTLPYHLMIDENMSFQSLIEESKAIFDLLEDNINMSFNGNLQAMTDFLVVYQHSDTLVKSSIDFGTFYLERKSLYATQVRFPIIFNFYETTSLKCEIEYSDFIDENLIKAVWEKVQILLDIVHNDPEKTIREIDLSTFSESSMKNTIDISFDF